MLTSVNLQRKNLDKKMVNLFLKAKHWQLFLLMFGIPIFLQMLLIGTTISEAVETENPLAVFRMMKWFPIILIPTMLISLGWMLSVGVGLQKHLPQYVNMKTFWLKFLLGFVGVYVTVITIFMNSLANDLTTHYLEQTSPEVTILSWVGILIPLHIISVVAMFYAMYFNAKSLRSIMLGKEAQSDKYLGYFFLFWFSFVGVWIMQPTINEIVEGTYQPKNNQSNNKSVNPSGNVTEERDLLD